MASDTGTTRPSSRSAADSPRTSTVFEALANVHRRGVLIALAERDEAVEEAALAADLLELERMSVDELTDRKRVRVALQHTHLPKLDGYGVLEYDPGEATVERGPLFEPTLSCLEAVRDELDGRFASDGDR